MCQIHFHPPPMSGMDPRTCIEEDSKVSLLALLYYLTYLYSHQCVSENSIFPIPQSFIIAVGIIWPTGSVQDRFQRILLLVGVPIAKFLRKFQSNTPLHW